MPSLRVFAPVSVDQNRQVCAELDRRVRAGETVRAEDYFQSLPGLASSVDSALEVIYAEFVARTESGQQPLVEDWYRRFPQWRQDLEELFQIHELMNESLTEEDASDLPGQGQAVAPGGCLGHFELIEEIGRGALGVVHKARDRNLQRLVALKVLRLGTAATKDLALFRREAESIAALHHPHIVQIHEIGESAGRLYLSLEFMEGGNLKQKLAAGPYSSIRAAALVETLARAMHYAHQQGILHRDLKPANILFTADGVAKIADFSLGGPFDRESQTPSADSPSGPRIILGTPGYMAPEQVGGVAGQIGPPADVYALGAILHELLGDRKINRDLEAIRGKCLRIEAAQRYANAGALADDLRRWLNGEPVQARPVGLWVQAWKWGQRHPARGALIAVSLLALLVLLAGSLAYNARLREAVLTATKSHAEAVEAATQLHEELEHSRCSLYDLQLTHVQAVQERDPGCGKAMLEDGRYCPADLRDFTWHYLYRLCQRKSLNLEMPGPVNQVSLSPDGRTLAIAYEIRASRERERPEVPQGRIDLVDLANGKTQATLAERAGPVTTAIFSPDGRVLATASGCAGNLRSGCLRFWDVAQPREIAVLQQDGPPIWSLAFRRDGRLLAAAGADQTVHLWDVTNTGKNARATARESAVLRGHKGNIHSVVFAPEGDRLASGGEDGTVRLWNTTTGQEEAVLQGHRAAVFAVAMSPDGRLLASGSADRTVILWDLIQQRTRTVLVGHEGGVRSVAFSPDGQTLASGSDDYTPKLWRVADGHDLTTLTVHGDPVTSVAFTTDSQRFISASRDGTVKGWDVVPGRQRPPLKGHQAKIVAARFIPSTGDLITASQDRTVKVWNTATGQPRLTLRGHSAAVCCLALSPDGQTLATGSDDRTVKLWDLRDGSERFSLSGHTDRVSCLAFSPDGNMLATGSFDRTVRIWDLAPIGRTDMPGPRQSRVVLHGHRGRIYGLAYAPDGKRLATASDDTTVRLWDVDRGKELAAVLAHRDAALCVAFHPDGKTLVSGGRDWRIRFWDARALTLRQLIWGHSHWVFSLVFSADGKTLASATGDNWPHARGEVKLWDAASGLIRATFPGQTAPIAFSPDGATLVTGNQDETINLLEAADDAP